MRKIKQWCVRFGNFLVWLGTDPVIHEDELMRLAINLTKRQQDNWPERDGECKRAAVYAQLVNTFPERSKREISVAIEEALLCGE